ncbi:N/A [soil metagenome]
MNGIDVDDLKNRAKSKVPVRLRAPLEVVIAAATRWTDHDGAQLGAAIAFYTMFALAPLLVVTIAIAGAVFGADAARGQIVAQVEGVVGATAAQGIETMIAAAWRVPGGLMAGVIGTVTLLVGASGVFGALRRALNVIADVTPPPSAVGAFVRARLIAFALVLGFGFLAIASLVVSAALSGVTGFFADRFPGLSILTTVFDLALSVAVLTVAFAALLRWLPDLPQSRRAVWLAALSSAVLFAVGKIIIGLYLGRATVASPYGAAGSFVVVMLWVYYSAQILLFGAAIGRSYDEYYGIKRGKHWGEFDVADDGAKPV